MFEQVLQSKASRICIIAAPGSGKTKRALIPKVTQILQSSDVDPKEVLLLTFSRLSAKDLKERVKILDRVPRASTVHALCLSFLLSENSHEIRGRVDSIMLDFEKEVLISDLKLQFPSIYKNDLAKLFGQFSAGWATQPHEIVFESTDLQKAFKGAVVNWLNEHAASTMEEIVYSAVALAKSLGSTEFLKKPKYIFVDEYQDLNKLEQEFIELLARESRLLFIVGDPDQSIYSFKYSYPDGIRNYSRMTGAEAYFSHETARCPKKIVEIANQLLKQIEPTRTQLLKSARDEDGEINFVHKQSQQKEFEYVLSSIAERLRNGARAKDIIVLVPKRPLGKQFVEYAAVNKGFVGIPNGCRFRFDAKIELTDREKEQILLMSLLVKPSSLLHIRSFLALNDTSSHSSEVSVLKRKYGDLLTVLRSADASDFSFQQTRVRALCERVSKLRDFLAIDRSGWSLDRKLDELFPWDDDDLKSLRAVIENLIEEGDSFENLCVKFIDQLRVIPTSDADIRVMTIMGSKGLDADHVYIIGCNSGNIPGKNRSSHLSDQQYLDEQRRLLFVGVTRAIKSLTISWARLIPQVQSRRHYTQGLGTVRQAGRQALEIMGMSGLLQDLEGITWQT